MNNIVVVVYVILIGDKSYAMSINELHSSMLLANVEQLAPFPPETRNKMGFYGKDVNGKDVYLGQYTIVIDAIDE
jgi:hypothetical protein